MTPAPPYPFDKGEEEKEEKKEKEEEEKLLLDRGTDGEIEGSIRGPRGPIKSTLL